MENHEKCTFCKYDRIDHILLHDLYVDECLDCGYAKYNIRDFDKLLNAIIYDENILNAKKYQRFSELSKKDLKIYNDIIASFIINHWKDSEHVKTECNFCGDHLYKMICPFYEKFKVYYCNYCGSVYFNPDELRNAVVEIYRKARRHSRWYGFIFRIIEIFL